MSVRWQTIFGEALKKRCFYNLRRDAGTLLVPSTFLTFVAAVFLRVVWVYKLVNIN